MKDGTPLERIKRHPVYVVLAVIVTLITTVVVMQSSLTTIAGWLAPHVPVASRYIDERAIADLVPGTHLSTFERALGPFVHKNNYAPYVEYIFVRPNCYVQAVTDADDRVLMYAVTVRNRDFHPSFRLPDDGSSPKPITLGVSRFSDSNYQPEVIRGCFGASWMHYMEFVRLPHSQDFLGVILASNDAGAWWDDVSTEPAPFAADDYPFPLNDALAANDVESKAIQWYRRNEIVNTYGEAAPDFDPEVLFEKDGMPKSQLVIGPDRVMVQVGVDPPD